MDLNKDIYFDNAATTKCNNEVAILFNKIENESFGNPNSIHRKGIESNTLLNKARDVIKKTFKVSDHRVIFTSSSTEANNLAIKGYCLNYANRGKHIITSNIEHPSVLECFRQLKNTFGFEVTILNVNLDGTIELDDLKSAMRETTILVSIMAVNNEIGSINKIDEIANIVHRYPKAILHVDTTQAIGKINLPYDKIDSFVVSGHKIHGLKGSGCLLSRKSIAYLPLISGGGQEDNFRSGTQSVALACSLAKAISLENKDIDKKYKYIFELNNLLREKINNIPHIVLNSSLNASPYILNFSLEKKKASVVVEALSNKNIYVSSVSACHSKKEQESYVVEAIQRDSTLASNTIRVSFDENNTKEEVIEFIKALEEILGSIK